MERTRVFLTVDTELAWRHYAAGHSADEIFARSIEPAGVGVGWQAQMLTAHGLRGCFFVDPMPAAVFGPEMVARIIAPILAAGQDVQLHIHPNWSRARADDRAVHAPFELLDYRRDEQAALIAASSDYLVAAGAPKPVAFRAGSYAADDSTMAALAGLGIAFDCSFNAAYPSLSKARLDPANLAPRPHAGVVAVPVGVIAEPGDRVRTLQICAVSTEEMAAALWHAHRNAHVVTTIVGHSFELATRCGTAINTAHRARFEWLCGFLQQHQDSFSTVTAADLHAMPLDRVDKPLPYDATRRMRRIAEQAWINQAIERPARRSRLELGAAKALPHVEVTAMAWNRWGYPLLESVEAAARGLM